MTSPSGPSTLIQLDALLEPPWPHVFVFFRRNSILARLWFPLSIVAFVLGQQQKTEKGRQRKQIQKQGEGGGGEGREGREKKKRRKSTKSMACQWVVEDSQHEGGQESIWTSWAPKVWKRFCWEAAKIYEIPIRFWTLPTRRASGRHLDPLGPNGSLKFLC